MLEGVCWHCHVGSVDLIETLLSYCTIKSIIWAIAKICDSLLLSKSIVCVIANICDSLAVWVAHISYEQC